MEIMDMARTLFEKVKNFNYTKSNSCSKSNRRRKKFNKFLEYKAPRGYKFQHDDNVHPNPVVSILRTRRKMAPDLAIVPNEPYVLKSTIPYLGPPLSDTNGNSHARIIVELDNHQSVCDWIAKCQMWLQVVHIRYVFAIKLHKPNNARDAQGLPAFIVNIPVNEIFFNLPTIPPPAGYIPIAPIEINPDANFTIDLYYI
ncbi:hypothetical protein C1646_670633 [Rhizophagus diaphanus]|nr:hypothetical protein C1646_670633 [Rhizophagus diaphanus] [Rhizophagus sp. MUCL 43196]